MPKLQSLLYTSVSIAVAVVVDDVVEAAGRITTGCSGKEHSRGGVLAVAVRRFAMVRSKVRWHIRWGGQ